MATSPSVFLSALFLAALLGAGCASQSRLVSYNASKGRMEYETREMKIIRRISSSGYGSSASIAMQASARCEGENCTPDVVRLMFLVSGNSEVTFEDRSVRILADGERYEWQDFFRQRQGEFLTQTTLAGQIGGVRLRLPQLAQIANAASVEGSIGSRSFELTEAQKDRLQEFLSAMRNPESTREAAPLEAEAADPGTRRRGRPQLP